MNPTGLYFAYLAVKRAAYRAYFRVAYRSPYGLSNADLPPAIKRALVIDPDRFSLGYLSRPRLIIKNRG